jgi:hypothetical protein
MVFPYTSCKRLSKKCIVDPKNSNCSECAYYSHRCDVDWSVVLQQIDAEQSKLLTEAQKAETKVSKLLLQALEVLSRTCYLCKQVDFLEGCKGCWDVQPGHPDEVPVVCRPSAPRISRKWSGSWI